MPPQESRYWKIQYVCQVAILKITSLKTNIGLFPCTKVMFQWHLDLTFKVKLKLESAWKAKIQNGQAAILKVISLKINTLMSMATNNMYVKLKFQSKLNLCSVNHVVYRRTDRQKDGQGESSIPPTNFVGQGYNKFNSMICHYTCNSFAKDSPQNDLYENI